MQKRFRLDGRLRARSGSAHASVTKWQPLTFTSCAASAAAVVAVMAGTGVGACGIEPGYLHTGRGRHWGGWRVIGGGLE